MIRPWGLRRKVLLVMGGIIATLLLVMALLLVHERSSRLEVLRISRDSQTQLVTDVAQGRVVAIATQLADAVTNDLYYFDLQSIGQLLGATLRQAPITQAVVYDGQGRIVHDGSREISTYGSSLDLALAREALAADGVRIRVEPTAVEAASRVRIGEEVLGGVLVRFDLDELNRTVAAGNRLLSERLEASAQLRLGTLAVLLALIALLGVASLVFIQRGVVRPILRLATAARRLEAGEYGSIRLHSGRRDEIGELEQVFERMSARVAEAHLSVERKAYIDKLTGLPNRRAFDEALGTRVQDAPGAGEFALLFMDVDNLKPINDRFGHAAGDAALIEFARRASDCLEARAPGRAWLARIGGDEFAVICDGSSIAQVATGHAEALIAMFRDQPPRLAPMALSVSVGIALHPLHASSASDLLRCADAAMYLAKQQGKNRVQMYRPEFA